MLNVITGLYILSLVAPTLLVILAWSRRPATIEKLVLNMTVLPILALAANVGLAMMVGTSYSALGYDIAGMVFAQIMMVAALITVACGLGNQAVTRIKEAENAPISLDEARARRTNKSA